MPAYQLSPVRICGGTGVMYSPSDGLKIDQPSRKCFWREWDLYWVSTRTRRNPESRQLLSVKSMIRYLPPNGTAGFARWAVSGYRREPTPPARMSVIVCWMMSAKAGTFYPCVPGFRRFLCEMPPRCEYQPGFTLVGRRDKGVRPDKTPGLSNRSPAVLGELFRQFFPPKTPGPIAFRGSRRIHTALRSQSQ